MKFYYIENLRLPTEKAHGVQIAKMCEVMADNGLDLTLLLPKKYTPIKEDIYSFYSVKNNFQVKKIFAFNLLSWEKYLGGLGYWLETLFYGIFALCYLIFHQKADVIYTREPLLAFIFKLFYKKVYFEAHVFKTNKFYKYLLKRLSGLIVITNKLKELYGQILPGMKILVAFDAVDLKQFNLDITKNQAKEKLNLIEERKIILYFGHLYGWKGAENVALASRFLPDDLIVYFVGGTAEDVDTFKKKYEGYNLKVLGHKPYSEAPYWMKAADVLTLPNSGKFEISRSYTSPMKLFEYMAAKRPIVASALPSIKEVLNDENSVLVEPDNPEELAKAIVKLLANPEIIEKITSKAFTEVLGYSWDSRAKSIINFIK